VAKFIFFHYIFKCSRGAATLSLTTLCINDVIDHGTQHCDTQLSNFSFFVMLGVIKLCGIMLSVIKLCGIMLSVTELCGIMLVDIRQASLGFVGLFCGSYAEYHQAVWYYAGCN
jgi:hypothetical protein